MHSEWCKNASMFVYGNYDAYRCVQWGLHDQTYSTTFVHTDRHGSSTTAGGPLFIFLGCVMSAYRRIMIARSSAFASKVFQLLLFIYNTMVEQFYIVQSVTWISWKAFVFNVPEIANLVRGLFLVNWYSYPLPAPCQFSCVSIINTCAVFMHLSPIKRKTLVSL